MKRLDLFLAHGIKLRTEKLTSELTSQATFQIAYLVSVVVMYQIA